MAASNNPYSTKSDKARYFLEVAENMRHKAQEAEKRIADAVKVGADNKDNKFHSMYIKLVSFKDSCWDYHTDYCKKYSEETKEPYPDLSGNEEKKEKN